MSSSQTIALDAFAALPLDRWPAEFQQPLDSYTDALAEQLVDSIYFSPSRTTGTFADHSRTDTSAFTPRATTSIWTETR